jgi:hypothetical protein
LGFATYRALTAARRRCGQAQDAIDAGLVREIEAIRAIDNHSHGDAADPGARGQASLYAKGDGLSRAHAISLLRSASGCAAHKQNPGARVARLE